MKALRPYLLRAFHDWMLDNGWTPLLIVDAAVEGTSVPQSHVQDGRIVLNISPQAVRNIDFGDEIVSFKARFSGSPFEVILPMPSLLGIYAEETGQVLGFPPEDLSAAGESDTPPAAEAENKSEKNDGSKDPKKGGPNLRIIK